MLKVRIFFPLSLFCVFFFLSTAFGQLYSDPRNPDARGVESELASVPFYKIQSRLDELSNELQNLSAELSVLPFFESSLLVDRFGYHSDYLPVLDELPEAPRWSIRFDMNHESGPLDLVLVPTADPRITGKVNYGFPKRFRIVSANRKRVFVDWTKEDFPDPGLRPVYFHLPDFKSRAVWLEVFSGENKKGLEFFSLSRVYMIRSREVRIITAVEASSELASPPYWGADYLSDNRFTIGLPLSGEASSSGDFIMPMEHPNLGSDLLIELDLGKNTKIGWINLYPSKNPEELAVPGYGFPRFFQIDVVPEDEHGNRLNATLIAKRREFDNPGNNLLRFPGFEIEGRYLRIQLNQFPVYSGQAVFGLGEIQVREKNLLARKTTVASANASIIYRGKVLDVDPSSLVDSVANGFECISPAHWLNGVASSKPVLVAMKNLEAEKASLQSRWSRGIGAVAILAVVLLFGGICYLIVALILGRREETINIRRQISSDLHDDIGSSVAAIGLASNYVQRTSQQDSVRESARRIRDISNRMHQSLRDVLWLTDTQTDTVSELIEKLVDLSRQNVSPRRLRLRFTCEEDVPRKSLKMQTKRDLLMFLKEALHNATVHSEAPEIKVDIFWQGKQLVIRVQDNGTGFELPEEWKSSSRHHGLSNLQVRAKRLGAVYDISSIPDVGTTVSLHVTL